MWDSRGRGTRRIRSQILGVAEVVLVTFGAVCLGWYTGVRAASLHEQQLLSRELEITRAPMAVVPALAPRSLIGRIEVPRLNLSAAAREGVDDRTLDLAVGHVPGTALPGDSGNSAFAAHRDTFFRPLRRVHSGDIVTVTTPRGSYRYIVTSTRVVDPEDVSVLDPTSEPTLTLVTCYPFTYIGSAPYRFVVRGELLPR
jgi:sortase A